MVIMEKTTEDLINEIEVLKNDNLRIKASFEKYKTLKDRAENKFKMLFQLSPIGMALADHTTGEFLEVNSSVLEATQYTREEFLNLNYWDITPREYKEQEAQQIKDLNETGYFGPYEKEYIRKDGTRYPLSIRGALFTNTNGKKVVWGIIEDITEQKLAVEVIKLKNKELTKLNFEKDKFFSIISHDLRTPFNGFLGLTELLSSGISQMSSEEIREFAIMMNDSAKSLYGLLENLLQWARLKEGLMPFIPSTINVYQLTQEVINIEKEAIKKKGLKLACHMDENLQVVADHYMLQSVFHNLLSNAIKFTPRKGEVVFLGKLLNEDLKISISDSGIGMNENLMNKLFKLGEKTSRNGTDGELSTGLGLFLCQGFVERHKGKLWAESEEGKGSVFHFTLPNKCEF
ncbi:MAG: PAS domain S-box-containing protein [Ancylomarina sp.]|jgi:PAS domain S-box-containing protein